MRWFRWCSLALLAVTLSGCGVLGAQAVPTASPAPTLAVTVAPRTATPAPTPPTATPAVQPAATPEPAASDTVYVGNTDGQGVYVRATPALADRTRAYADGTPLTIIGDDVEGDGLQWKHVRTPDGLEGYVPAMYTSDAPP